MDDNLPQQVLVLESRCGRIVIAPFSLRLPRDFSVSACGGPVRIESSWKPDWCHCEFKVFDRK